MTKAQIVDRIAGATGLTKIETEAVVDGFMHTVLDAVADGDRVELRGFGTFKAVERAPRTARNPRTDETVRVPRRYSPVFKPAQEFRRVVEELGKQRLGTKS
ncbi:MAG: HU family DNA-binding protein [Rubricoccaceae bacterium]